MRFESDFEEDFEAQDDAFLGDIAGGISSVLGGLSGFEDDFLFEDDSFESENDNSEAAEAAALMEVLADHVAEADSSAEADEFLPILAALAPLAMKALPAITKLAPRVIGIGRRVVPQLARGVVKIGRQLARSPAGRQAIRALPTIARKTAADVLQNVARGQPLTANGVTRSLAKNTAQILRHPQRRQAAIRRNRRVAQHGRSSLPCRCP
jgi:hypothetical protein